MANIHTFQVKNSRIDIYGNTGIVSYDFEMKYEIKGEIHMDNG